MNNTITTIPLRGSLFSIAKFVQAEIYLGWRFIGRDLSTMVIPPLFFTIAASKSMGTLGSMLGLTAVINSFFYFILYGLTFCISNQMVGIEEDRHNKPERPLVSGLCSYNGATLRWLISMSLYTILGAQLGVLGWTLLWQAVLIHHNFMGGAKHWFSKNIAMGLGTLAQLAAAWQIAQPTITPLAWNWIIFLAMILAFALVTVQDLRDMTGDELVGRRTFPLVFGARLTRLQSGFGFAVLPILIHFALIVPAANEWYVGLCELVLVLTSLAIAYRVLFLRSPQADHRTYMWYTYLYCFALASAIILL